MQETIIREFRPEDAADVSRIICDSFKDVFRGELPAYFTAIHTPEKMVEAAASKDPFNDHVCLVAVNAGKVIGYARGSAHVCGLGSWETVAVDPGFRKGGVATAFMERMLQFWNEKGTRKVSSCVTASNTRAVLFYFKHGFTVEGYRKDHFAPGMDEIIIARFL
jgi:ribosomal protein S18 acetylase RimI-like enzyme